MRKVREALALCCFVVLRLSVVSSQTLARLDCSLYSGGGLDTCCQGLAYLYPFGNAALDSLGGSGDDATSVSLNWVGAPFKFLGNTYNTMFFSTNGWLSFSSSDPTYASVAFPTYSNPVSLEICEGGGWVACNAMIFAASGACRVLRRGGWI
jgi:hypothetical protein